MERMNIAAFTEATAESYPAYVSINREADGTIKLTARERGHGGEKQVELTGAYLAPHVSRYVEAASS